MHDIISFLSVSCLGTWFGGTVNIYCLYYFLYACCLDLLFALAIECPVQTSFVVISVKYLNEVMPYFRKASVLSEIGWDFSRSSGFLVQNFISEHQVDKINGKSDTKKIPLLLCHLTKPIVPQSPEAAKYAIEDSLVNRVFEIYSPSRQNVCILRCRDAAQTAAWFSAIHSVICRLIHQSIAEANNLLDDMLDGAKLKYMGWLYEKVVSNTSLYVKVNINMTPFFRPLTLVPHFGGLYFLLPLIGTFLCMTLCLGLKNHGRFRRIAFL